MSDQRDKPKRVIEPIPDSFENVLKAVVQPAQPQDSEVPDDEQGPEQAEE